LTLFHSHFLFFPQMEDPLLLSLFILARLLIMIFEVLVAKYIAESWIYLIKKTVYRPLPDVFAVAIFVFSLFVTSFGARIVINFYI